MQSIIQSAWHKVLNKVKIKTRKLTEYILNASLSQSEATLLSKAKCKP